MGCGPLTSSTKGFEMQEYKLRTVTGIEYTALLSEEDAKARGLLKSPENKKAAAENKAVTEETPQRRPGAAPRKR